MLTAK